MTTVVFTIHVKYHMNKEAGVGVGRVREWAGVGGGGGGRGYKLLLFEDFSTTMTIEDHTQFVILFTTFLLPKFYYRKKS